MNKSHSMRRSLRCAWRTGVAAAALLSVPAGLGGFASPAAAQLQIEETNRYFLRYASQIFDGTRELSHTQTAGVARMRRGEESWTMLNFGGGAVVAERAGAFGGDSFANTVGTEVSLRYDYSAGTIEGNSAIADYHNSYVVPQLGRSPALGQDAHWMAQLTLADLGFAGLSGPPVSIELSRDYFSHDGRDYVLVHYRVPAFRYAGADGQPVVQWGQGVAVTDPGFGEVYWNAALFRAVAEEQGSSGRPYRFSRSIIAVEPGGAPMIDPREMPEVAPYLDRLYGHSNSEIIAFQQDGGGADQTPVRLASRLDVMALSIGENGANEVPELTAAQNLPSGDQLTGEPIGTTGNQETTVVIGSELPETPFATSATSELSISELEISEVSFEPPTWEPVEFDPPTWDPPTWDPPVWVPPEFDAPDPSEIPWTDFDDDDWPNQAHYTVFDYPNMEGIVETDLSEWEDWLATQNLRELERLALQAGYPNLASALADAENIIRLSQDQGYRQWAMQAPSCGGLVGCGPSFLERWSMKQSIVALGDILNASRDVFSTGGLTDIGLTSVSLMYMLRDFGLEDGDIVDIEILQFGQSIFTSQVTLTNDGEDFEIDLERGIAALTITAVNEGSASPNTAEITLENVISGNATQTYSLLTGETATLRIEAGGE